MRLLLLTLTLMIAGCGSPQSGSTIDWELERHGRKAVLLVGRLRVVFHNIPMQGGDQPLAKGFFKVPAAGESREPGSGGASYNELTVKESWQEGVNTISFNDYGFQLVENGTKLRFGDQVFALGDKKTIVVAEDGTVSTNAD
jgi:hypothetical protein